MDRTINDELRENEGYNGSKEDDEQLISFNFRVLFVDCIKGIKKFWYLFIIIVLITSTGMFLYSKKGYVPMYKSSATFSISTLNSGSSYAYYYSYSLSSSLEIAFPYIINSPVMRNILKNELGVSYINGTYSAESIPSSNLFTITVTSTSPQDAYKILNAIIDCYPMVADYVIGETQIEFITQPELNNIPYTQSTIKRDVLFGAVAGAALWSVFILFYAFTRNTVRSSNDITDKLGQQCIAEIPFVRRRKNEQGTLLAISKKLSLFSEAYRTLRTRLLAISQESGAKVFAVTSTSSGEGKTTVAFNIAYSLASAGKKVALVDLDLKRKTLQSVVFPEEKNLPGISDVVENKITLINTFKKYKHNNMHVYCAGSGKNFSEKKYRQVFDDLRTLYDYVIIDAPPGGIVYEAVSVTSLADGVLFVVLQDKITLGKIREAIEGLFFSKSQITGFVFNGVRADYKNYGGYYYGGYRYGSYKYGSYRYSSYRYGKYGYYGKYQKYGYGGYGYGYGENNADISADISEPD